MSLGSVFLDVIHQNLILNEKMSNIQMPIKVLKSESMPYFLIVSLNIS